MLFRTHLLALTALSVALSLPASAASTAAFGTNLVVNGDAEAELGAPDSSGVVKPSGWTVTGNFTSVRYGASGGFPDATSPGPKTRGKSLFEGGNGPQATASQTISLTAFAAAIDAGGVTETFSAWLGGYSTQSDNARVSVTFKNAAGASLGGLSLGPVSAAARKDETGLVSASKTGHVPKGARSALVTIVLTRVDGAYNDGSVDDLSLVLAKKP